MERAEIVQGKKDAPPPAEGEAAAEAEDAEAADAKEGGDAEKEGEGEEVPDGVPEFWLNVLRNYEDIGEKVRLCLQLW